MLKIKKKDFIFGLVLLLIIFASIPYLFYAIPIIRYGGRVIGGLNSNITTSTFGTIFSYLKDIVALLLFIFTFFSKKYKKSSSQILLFSVLLFTYGILALFLSGRDKFEFIIAGFRTYIFCLSMMMYCAQYSSDIELKYIKRLYKVIQYCVIFQVVFTLGEIYISDGFASIGAGAYRFSGLFPGSGNLGYYAVSVNILFLILKQKFNLLSNKTIIINSIFLLFLAFASGTRTAIILVGVIFLYIVFKIWGEKIRINKKIIIFLFMIFVLIYLPDFLALITEKIGRGNLMISGSGRYFLFANMFDSANIFELLFGRGIGVGTNASITMGLEGTNISDSTINLIFTQFGLLGLGISLVILIATFKKILLGTKENKDLGIILIIIITVVYVISNLFEQIAMIIHLILAYYFLLDVNNKYNASD